MMLKRIKSKDQGLRFDVIDKLLKKRKGHTVQEITSHVNNVLEGEGIKVDKRTIYSDLNDLRDKYKLNILKEGSRYKYADSNDGYRKPRAESADKEMLALGLEAFASLKHLSFFDKFSDVVNRLLVGNLYEGIKEEEKKRIIQIGESYNGSGYQYIEKIYHAIKNKKAIRVLYTNNAGLMNWRIISPYILKDYRNQWYMVGYTTDSSRGPSSSVFALSKIESLTILDQAVYVIDESFNTDDYFKYSLGVYHDLYKEPIVVKLKFTGAIHVQRLKTSKLHSTMELISMTDNEIVVSMEVYNSPDLTALILGFKNEVEVVGPEILRDEIKNIIGEMANIYK
jgi:predicted DNA-binding transcriptional regulator YafY